MFQIDISLWHTVEVSEPSFTDNSALLWSMGICVVPLSFGLL